MPSARCPCVWIVRPASDRIREPASRNVGDGDVLENLAQRRPHRDPDRLQMLRGAGVGHVLRTLSPHLGQRALDGAEDIGKRDVSAITSEAIATTAPPLAHDEARPAKVDEQVLDELRRELLRSSDGFSGERTIRLRQGQKCPGRVVDPGGDIHRVMVADG